MPLQNKSLSLFVGAILMTLILGQFCLSACGGKIQITATPTRTARPAATATPLPTATPTAVSATATATPPPTADASIMIEFPPDVNPLTGLQVSDPAVLERRPLAVKISNSPAIVRPQAGLSLADLVFEHYAEGGVTRFTALYLSQDSPKIGSIRSGRLIDLEIPAMFKSMFAYSGSSGGVKEKTIASDLYQDNQIISPDFGVGEPVFYRVPEANKAFEHTLFTNTQALWALTSERGLNTRQDLQGLAFSASPSSGGEPAEYIELTYLAGVASAEWTYDQTSGLYRRAILGEPHTDALTGEQLTAANVIIVYANHVDTDILEDLVGGGHYSIEIQIWGQGPVQIVRDGHVYNGSWIRQAREDLLSFVDETGQPLPLKPGNSWYQFVPLNFPTVIQP
jgi:hypothetical protein